MGRMKPASVQRQRYGLGGICHGPEQGQDRAWSIQGIEKWAQECLLGSCTKAHRALFSAMSAIGDWECFLAGTDQGQDTP